jgi:hypothetical protein
MFGRRNGQPEVPELDIRGETATVRTAPAASGDEPVDAPEAGESRDLTVPKTKWY